MASKPGRSIPHSSPKANAKNRATKPARRRPSPNVDKLKCPLHAGYCSEHGFTHGAEAEELREKIQKLIDSATTDEYGTLIIYADDLGELLDSTDSRDSTAFAELAAGAGETLRKPKPRAGRVRIKKGARRGS